MASSTELVAVVTGASRGIGRGAAMGLGEAGAAVVVTGRSVTGAGTAGGLEETVALVEQAGGRGIAMRCDHRDDAQVGAVFDAVAATLGHVDVLVNNATSITNLAELFGDAPFWQLEPSVWDELFTVGLRSHFIASRLAVPLMSAPGGLIVNVSSAGAAQRIGAVLPYGVAKAALDRMTADMASELDTVGITVVSIWPPPTSTPDMLAEAAATGEDPSYMSQPLYTGRVIAALAADPEHHRWTGQAVRAADLAQAYDVAPMPHSAT